MLKLEELRNTHNLSDLLDLNDDFDYSTSFMQEAVNFNVKLSIFFF